MVLACPAVWLLSCQDYAQLGSECDSGKECVDGVADDDGGSIENPPVCPCANIGAAVVTPWDVLENSDAFLGNQVWMIGTVRAGRNGTCGQVECSELDPCCQPCGSSVTLDGVVELSGPNRFGGYTGCTGNNCEMTCTPPLRQRLCVNGTVRESDNDDWIGFFLDVDFTNAGSYCEVPPE